MLSRFIHVVQGISTLFFFYGWIIFHRMDIPHFSFPGGSHGKDFCNAERHGFDPWVGKIPLEKGMPTHSSIIAWRIPWTEEPGRLQSMGSRRIRHNWVIVTFTMFCLSINGWAFWLFPPWEYLILLLTFVYKLFFLYKLLFSCLLGIFLGVELLVIW